jgi:hypothetical protein
MTTETQTTTAAATPTEGGDSSATATETTATVADSGSQQQTAQSATDVTATGSDKETEAKPEGAPEAYSFTAPEGHEFDPHTLAAFSDVAKELNLPQESAQKVLDKMGPAMAEKQAAQMEQATAEWASSSSSDKEFGGAALEQNMDVAKKALDAFGTPELRTLLNETGLGNHPEIIRVLYRAGKAISEDTFVGRAGGNAPPSNDAKSFYPNSKMN